MLIRAPQRLLALCLLGLPVAAGCVTESKIIDGVAVFPWTSTSEVPDSREKLKNPSQLDLSYAQWQEHLGNLPEAELSYKRVLETDPKSIDAKLGIARLAQLSGQADVAEAAYLEAVEAAPQSALALDALGQFYAAGHRWSDAVTTLARATQAAPDDQTTRFHYAVALARSGDLTAAHTQFTRSVGEAEGYYNLGFILYEQGQLTAAEQAFQKAVSLRSDLSAAQQMLAELQQRNGLQAEITNAANRPADDRVTPTAAVANPNSNHHVRPASAIAPEQPIPNSEKPAVIPSAPQAGSETPAPSTTVTETSPAPSQDLPRWEMPTRREPALLSADQIQSHAASP